MKNKILIVLPYKESLNPNKAGAVSLFVTDTKKYSKFKKNIKIFSSETKSKNMLFTNRIETLLGKLSMKSMEMELHFLK